MAYSYYEILECSENATSSAIQHAYEYCVFFWNPSTIETKDIRENIDKDKIIEISDQVTQLIEAAYENLFNPQKRAEYDKHKTQFTIEDKESFDLIKYDLNKIAPYPGSEEAQLQLRCLQSRAESTRIEIERVNCLPLPCRSAPTNNKFKPLPAPPQVSRIPSSTIPMPAANAKPDLGSSQVIANTKSPVSNQPMIMQAALEPSSRLSIPKTSYNPAPSYNAPYPPYGSNFVLFPPQNIEVTISKLYERKGNDIRWSSISIYCKTSFILGKYNKHIKSLIANNPNIRLDDKHLTLLTLSFQNPMHPLCGQELLALAESVPHNGKVNIHWSANHSIVPKEDVELLKAIDLKLYDKVGNIFNSFFN